MARQAQPVYGTIHPHQSRGVQIADDPIVLDGPVARHALGLVGYSGVLVDLHLSTSSSEADLYGASSPPHYPSYRYRVSDGLALHHLRGVPVRGFRIVP